MARNVEIKARLEDTEAVRRRAVALSDTPPRILEQHDSFFRCAKGRLKLREFGDGSAELIHYERPDCSGPSESRYQKAPVGDAEATRRLLAAAYGSAGEVIKHRTLLLAGQTRIHLDEVAGLGNFLELEVVLEDGQSAAEGARTAHELLRSLGIDPCCLEARAYVDLLGRNEDER